MDDDKPEQFDEKDLDYLYERRENLDSTRIDISQSFDKYLFTAATGSLVLSVSFTNNISNDLEYMWLLGWGWFFLVVTILLLLVAIRLSVASFNRQIKITDSEIDLLLGYSNEICRKNYWNKIINLFEWISVFSFILGIGMLSIFYFINLKV